MSLSTRSVSRILHTAAGLSRCLPSISTTVRTSSSSQSSLCHSTNCAHHNPSSHLTWSPRAFSSSARALASEADPLNDAADIIKRLSASPSAMAAVQKVFTVMKDEAGINIEGLVRADGSVDPSAAPPRPSLMQMGKMMMNSKVRQAVMELHAEMIKAGIELTPERAKAIFEAGTQYRGPKK
ncbi:hypothetical protein OC846_000952 [Tilletia horrida]|uniref:Uncharacterized protein n=1 Tax=Tilletia horrida TaxID=155126 RepID=A0AAN6GUR8_9BASI|nr:hypothetical protein OC846_000952 [Tilletia horrida]